MLLHIPTLSESIKLVLKEGSGPVYITAGVDTEIVNEEKVELPPAKKKKTADAPAPKVCQFPLSLFSR
jgi:hypothetical protein